MVIVVVPFSNPKNELVRSNGPNDITIETTTLLLTLLSFASGGHLMNNPKAAAGALILAY